MSQLQPAVLIFAFVGQAFIVGCWLLWWRRRARWQASPEFRRRLKDLRRDIHVDAATLAHRAAKDGAGRRPRPALAVALIFGLYAAVALLVGWLDHNRYLLYTAGGIVALGALAAPVAFLKQRRRDGLLETMAFDEGPSFISPSHGAVYLGPSLCLIQGLLEPTPAAGLRYDEGAHALVLLELKGGYTRSAVSALRVGDGRSIRLPASLSPAAGRALAAAFAV